MISDLKAVGIIISSTSAILIVAMVIAILHRIYWKRSDQKFKESLRLFPKDRHHHYHFSLSAPPPSHHPSASSLDRHYHHHHDLHHQEYHHTPPHQHHQHHLHPDQHSRRHHHTHRRSEPTPFHGSQKSELLSVSTPEFLAKSGAIEESKPKLIVKQRTLPTVPEKHSDFQPDKSKPGKLGISNPFFTRNVEDEDEYHSNIFQSKTAQRIQPRSNFRFPSSSSSVSNWKSHSIEDEFSRLSIVSTADSVPYLMESMETNPNSPSQRQQFSGKIHLRLDLESSSQRLTIAILKATDLPNCEYTGTADPYCKLDMLNDFGLQASYQTKIQRKTLNPTFNEKFSVCCEGISTYQIQASLYDFDRFSRHRLIGYAVFEQSMAGLESSVCKELIMDLKRDHQQEKCHNLGQLLVSLRYLPTAGRLTVSIIKALHLSTHCDLEEEEEEEKEKDEEEEEKEKKEEKEEEEDADGRDGEIRAEGEMNGETGNEKRTSEIASVHVERSCMPDPYVKVTLMCHGRQVKKKKTSTKQSTTEPVYNESINFDVPQESIDQVHLDLRLHSKKSPSSKMLGACAIGPQFLGTSRDHWTAMLQYPRRPIAKWYQLSPYVKS